MVPYPPLTPAKGPLRARVGMLTGCVQRVFFPHVNAATARVLAAAHPGVEGDAVDELHLAEVRHAGVTALLVTVLAGALPAAWVARGNLGEALKEGGRTSTSGPRTRALRSALAIGQVTLATMLLVGAGLLARSLVSLLRVERGRGEPDATAAECHGGQSRDQQVEGESGQRLAGRRPDTHLAQRGRAQAEHRDQTAEGRDHDEGRTTERGSARRLRSPLPLVHVSTPTRAFACVCMF